MKKKTPTPPRLLHQSSVLIDNRRSPTRKQTNRPNIGWHSREASDDTWKRQNVAMSRTLLVPTIVSCFLVARNNDGQIALGETVVPGVAVRELFFDVATVNCPVMATFFRGMLLVVRFLLLQPLPSALPHLHRWLQRIFMTVFSGPLPRGLHNKNRQSPASRPKLLQPPHSIESEQNTSQMEMHNQI